MTKGQWYEGDEIETFIDNFFLSSWSVDWRPELVRKILQREGVEVTRVWESSSLHAEGPVPDKYTVVFYGKEHALVILDNGEYADWTVIPIA